MRFGITCFLTDRDMNPSDLARAAEERGFTSLFLPEHTHLPVRADTPPALVEGVRIDDYKRSLDPFVALATAVPVTSTLRLGTGTGARGARRSVGVVAADPGAAAAGLVAHRSAAACI